MVAALVRPHPLSSLGEVDLQVAEGATLLEIARLVWPDRATHRFVVAYVGNVRVPSTEWSRVRPKDGAIVRMGLTCLRGGGDNDKSGLAAVAMIVIAVVATYFTGPAGLALTGATQSAVAAGITIAGSLIVSHLFKPPDLNAGGGSSNPADAPTYSITGQANQATPYGPMLRVYGRHRIFPRIAAAPFTTTEGPNQFLFMLLDCGYGPLDVDNLQIGDTPILNYRDVVYKVHERWHAGDTLDLYRNEATVEAVGVTLKAGVAALRTSAADATGLVFDFAFPGGLVTFNDRGEHVVRQVAFDLEIRPAGSTGAWQPARSFVYTLSRGFSTAVNLSPFIMFADQSGGKPGTGVFTKGRTDFQIVNFADVQVGDSAYFLGASHTVTFVGTLPGKLGRRMQFTPAVPRDYYGAQTYVYISRPIAGIVIADATTSAVLFSITVEVPRGRWETRVTRTTADSTSDRTIDTLVWQVLRSITDRAPIAVQSDHTIIELKIRATEQLQGVVQNVNCIATAKLPVFDGNVPPPGSVHFDFLTDGQVQPLFGDDLATLAVTRTGVATRVNPAGLVEVVAANTPRFDFDPITLAPLGFLIEPSASNFVFPSEDLRDAGEGNPVAGWLEYVAADVEVAQVTGLVTAPNGATTVSKLRCTTVGVVQRQTQRNVAGLADNTIFCASIYAHVAEVKALSVYGVNKIPGYPFATFDLVAGTMIQSSATAGQGIQNVGGGWFRCWVAFDSKTGTGPVGTLFQLKTQAGAHYGGAVGDGLYLWGAMLEQGGAPTSYIPTTNAAVARGADTPVVADISKFYNVDEGTLVVEFDRTAFYLAPPNIYPWAAAFDNGTSAERLGVFVNDPVAGKQVSILVRDNAVNVVNNWASASAVGAAIGVPMRTAFSWKLNRFESATNGSAGFADTVGTLPTVNRLILGGGDSTIIGHVRKFTYYPFAFAAADVVFLSGSTANLAPGLWVEQATRNPAWAYADVLVGSGAMRPLPVTRLDLDRLVDWAAYCDALVDNGIDGALEPRVYFDHVVDYTTTTYQLLQSIASAGRAAPAVRDGLHGVIVDEERDVPVQVFTPRNSWGFSARRAYLTEPDALRVKFIDPASNWQDGEIVVYAAGANAENSQTFEDMKLFGVTRYTQATRDGRYLKAQALLRREEFTIQVDVENLIASRGDLVIVQHDVMRVGGESARIKTVAGATLTLDEPFGALQGARYGVRIRLTDGTITDPIEVTPQAPDKLILSSVPVPAPVAGNLVVWGFLEVEAGEYLVKQVAPGDDLSAQLSLVEIARDVYLADQGDIPPYVPPSGARPTEGPGPQVERLRIEQRNKTIAREPYADLVLTWDAPAVGPFPRYRVFRIEDAGPVVQLAVTTDPAIEVATNVRLLDPDVTSTPITFGVVGIDSIGREGDPAFVTFTPTDPLLVPGDANYLSSNVHDKTTTLTWFAPDNPAEFGNEQIQFYEVRWAADSLLATWGTASRVTELVPWNVTVVTLPSRNGAYLVKAITGSLIESTNAAVTVIAVEDIVIQDFWRTIRFEPAWDGVKENVVVDSLNRLVLAENPDGTYPAVGVFYSNDREIFNEVLQMRVSATAQQGALNNQLLMADWVPLAMAVPLAGARQGVDWNSSIWIDAEADPFVMASWVPLAIAAPLDPTPPVTGGSWRPLLHGEYIARAVRFAVVLESFQPNITPRISSAGVDIDFPERAEEHPDVLVPIAGLDFLFDRPFVFAPSIAIDLQDAAPGDYVDRGDVGQAGFPLFVRDAFGAAKSGVVDVSAFGVGRVLP